MLGGKYEEQLAWYSWSGDPNMDLWTQIQGEKGGNLANTLDAPLQLWKI